MKNLKFFLAFTLFFTVITLNSQNYFSQIISDNLAKYSSENYPEKIYVHTDKTYYSNEDTVWFSVYLVNGITHRKTDKSFLIYTELINEKDSIIDRKKLFINGLSTSGDFKLSKKINSGTYKIRAYTNYMRNQGSAYFFQKELLILSTENKTINDKNITKDSIYTVNTEFKPNLNFYPQGGYMVNNLLNRVAIKLKNDIYNKIKVSGIITDENNNEITKFSSTEFGLGEFSMIPEKGKKYFAVIKENDKVYKYQLPIALEKGFVLNAINAQKELLLELNATTINGLLGTSLVIHQRGKLVYNNTFKEAIKRKKLRIPTYKLTSGILHLTLFNSNAQPVSERLIFVENENESTANISIEKPKDYYGNRKKVTLKINVKDKESLVIPSKLSMTVRNVNVSLKGSYSENIKTWLLLNSDLRGKIKNPNYFFENGNSRKQKYLLDLVMLTHGWRRFTWQEINNNRLIAPKFEAEKGLYISGKTLDMKSPYRIKSVSTRLTFAGGTFEQEPIKKSNEYGKYSYGPFIFFDSIPIILEARTTNFKSKKDSDREVLIIPKIKEEIAHIIPDTSAINNKKSKEDLDSYLKFQKYLVEVNAKFKQYENVLDEVVVKSKLKDKTDLRNEEMNSRTSYGNAFNRFDVTENNFGGTALDLFIGMPGVRVVNDSIIVSRFQNVPPLILYDETPIDIADLSIISADEVSFIDVLTGGEGAQFSSGGVVISIYSKQGGGFNSKRNVKRKPGIIDYKASGFYTAQEFYAPDHINGIEEQTKPDLRTTLHWVPNITVINEKAIEISFFTSDTDSEYLIEIQGITGSGIPLYKTSKIIVD